MMLALVAVLLLLGHSTASTCPKPCVPEIYNQWQDNRYRAGLSVLAPADYKVQRPFSLTLVFDRSPRKVENLWIPGGNINKSRLKGRFLLLTIVPYQAFIKGSVVKINYLVHHWKRMAKITEVRFWKKRACSNTACPTGKQPMTTSKPVTTSASQLQQCEKVFKVVELQPDYIKINLSLPVAAAMKGWKLTIQFDKPVIRMTNFPAKITEQRNMQYFVLENHVHNADVAPGIFSLIFMAHFDRNYQSPPKVVMLKFGSFSCKAGDNLTPPPTATAPPSTMPTKPPTTSRPKVTTNAPVTTSAPKVTSNAPLTTKQPEETTAGPKVTTGGSEATTKPAQQTTPSGSCTPEFDYGKVLRLSLLFYEAQRSGKLPASNRIPYRKDSALNDRGSNGEDLTGGYYDAGDFVKFNFPMAYTITVLSWGMIQYEDAYKASGEYQNMLDAIKWGTDYFIKCHTAKFELYGQVGDGHADHAYWGRPEDMKMARPAFKIDAAKPGSDLAGETAAALAAASVVFKSKPAYSKKLLAHAKDLYEFADKYRAKYSDSIPNAANFYRSWSGYNDELTWAAAWLYRASKEQKYLTAAKSFYNQFGMAGTPQEFSWDDKKAGVQVLMAQITGQAMYKNAVGAFCDSAMRKPKTPGGLVYITQWGTNRHAANIAFICLQAADLGIKQTQYRNFARSQIHYMLGKPNSPRSFVVGFGRNPPQRPHHRSSSCPNTPAACSWNDYNSPKANPQILYGALVGGPGQDGSYVDNRRDYIKNEVACDYNAGFQSALAGLRHLQNNEDCGKVPATTSAPLVTTNAPLPTKQPEITTVRPKVTTGSLEVTTKPSGSCTPEFDYGKVLRLSLLFYEAQRSGKLPASNRIPYRKDSALNDRGSKGEDLTGGYYDAGDFVKFNFPMAYTITVLSWGMIQYEDAYKASGEYQNMLDAIKWGTDYFIKCHTAKFELYGQVGDGHADHAYWGRPEDMKMARPAFKIDSAKPGSDLAGETAAALAAASVVFKSKPAYSKKLLAHAKDLYEFADKYRAKYSDSIPNAANFYRSWSGYNDELTWAAAWLYRASKEQKYLTAAKSFYNQFGMGGTPQEFSWDDKKAGVQVLMAQITGQAMYKNAVGAFCDSAMRKPKTPGGLVYITQWGTNRHAANIAFICLQAADLGIKQTQYRNFARSQIHYMLGKPNSPRSFVVGFGRNPPQRPHHRSSSCPNTPAACSWNDYNSPKANPQILYGALVGGPGKDGSYVDNRRDYIKNEVACDYNAGFQSALAGLRHLQNNGKC